jgi:hypothetical protein
MIMPKYKEVLDNLNTQLKQVEANFHKLQGAIEIVASMQADDKRESAAAKKKAKAK